MEFAAMHAAIALTAAQDVVGLTLLGRNAALDRRPVFRDVVEATLLHALAASGRLEPARALIQRQLDRSVAPAGPIREEPAP